MPTTGGRAALFVAATLAAATIAGPAAADKPTVETETFSFADVNPCTGLEHVVTATVTMRIHHHGDRIVSTNRWEVVTSDGYVGGGPETLVVNKNIVSFPLNLMMTNESGSKIRVHIVELVDLRTEPPSTKLFDLVITCVKHR